MPRIIDPLKDIMYGLIYPAVLGTGLVLFVLHLARRSPALWVYDLSLYPAVAAGFFYTLSFTALSETEEDKARLSYQWPAFSADWIEVALMFACFYFLGLMDDQAPAPHLVPAYTVLLVDVIIVQPLWRLVAGVSMYAFIGARAIVAALLLAGIICSLLSVFHPWIDLLVAVTVVAFVIYYIARGAEFQTQNQQVGRQ